jgi:zinc transport system substrate-binding protein
MSPHRLLWSNIICAIAILLSPIQSEARLKITTTILPLTAHTMSLCGDLADVRQLIPPNVGLHDFKPRPSEVRLLQDSDLIIINGISLELWINDLLKSSPKKRTIIDTSAGIETIDDNLSALEGCTHDHSEEHHHHHHGPNPHIWLDPVLSKQQVQNILKGLIKADPHNKSHYEANAKAYLNRLDNLHKRFTEALAPLKKKPLITFHNSFPYFAKRYGIQYLGFIEQLPHQSPSPKRIANLIKIIRQQEAAIIFTEVGYPPKLIQTLSRETGARIASLNTLEIGNPNPNAYFEAMEANLETLKKSWR